MLRFASGVVQTTRAYACAARRQHTNAFQIRKAVPGRVPILRNRSAPRNLSLPHVLVGEPAATPHQVRGRLSPERALRHHATHVDQARQAAAAECTARIVGVEPDLVRGKRRGQKAASDALPAPSCSFCRIVQPVGHGCCFRPATTLHTAPLRGASDMLGSEADGAGEGIRTLDPNLGKVVLYP